MCQWCYVSYEQPCHKKRVCKPKPKPKKCPAPRFNCRYGLDDGQIRIDFKPWDFYVVNFPDGVVPPSNFLTIFPKDCCEGDQIAFRVTGVSSLKFSTLGTSETTDGSGAQTVGPNQTVIWVYCKDLQPHWRILIEGSTSGGK